MKNNERIQERICPKCGRAYSAPPALSRVDNETYICPRCGTLEALTMGLKLSMEEAERIACAIDEAEGRCRNEEAR